MISKLTNQKLRRENLYFLTVYKVALLIFLLFYAILIENKKYIGACFCDYGRN
mgnify:CR=1 FL=1